MDRTTNDDPFDHSYNRSSSYIAPFAVRHGIPLYAGKFYNLSFETKKELIEKYKLTDEPLVGMLAHYHFFSTALECAHDLGVLDDLLEDIDARSSKRVVATPKMTLTPEERLARRRENRRLRDRKAAQAKAAAEGREYYTIRAHLTDEERIEAERVRKQRRVINNKRSMEERKRQKAEEYRLRQNDPIFIAAQQAKREERLAKRRINDKAKRDARRLERTEERARRNERDRRRRQEEAAKKPAKMTLEERRAKNIARKRAKLAKMTPEQIAKFRKDAADYSKKYFSAKRERMQAARNTEGKGVLEPVD